VTGSPTSESAAGLARAVAAGAVSARESVDAHLARIDALNPRLNALTRVLREEPLGDGPLAGVPFTVKENIDLAGTPTTFGLTGESADKPLDAPHVAHLRAAGAVPVGRGNLPDLALRWDTESARYGRTLNPWDAALSPGGSSGGDAVAVATGMVPFAVGSDYGGSLRVPGALAGVYALRPTPGRVAQSHSVPPSMSRQLFATDGLLARSVEDLKLLLPIMARPSARDPRWTPAEFAGASGPIGSVLEDTAVRIAAEALTDAGHTVTPVEPPRLEEVAQQWIDVLAFDSGPSALPRIREAGCEGTRRFFEALLALAAPLDGPGYARALAERYEITAEWSALLDRHRVIVGPVSTAEPWPVGHDLAGVEAVREQWWGYRLTVAVSALALPAIAVPVGLDDQGRPRAVQLIAERWHEATLLDVAAELEARVGPRREAAGPVAH
jgi:amidase